MVERREIERDLREAIEKEQFRVLYQPQIDLRTGEVVGVEALVRWDHPRRGLLSPADFLSLAEETGLIVPIGNWVLQESLRQAEQWRRARPDGNFQISVNLSAPQHEDPNLVRNIETALATTGTDPSQLCLEITETVVMKDVEATRKVLESLKGLGTKLSVDDFGTGYSSLTLAAELPRRLAEGRSLVRLRPRQRTRRRGRGDRHRGDQPRPQPRPDRRRGGHRDRRAAAALREMDCDMAQGYYFARPRPAAAIGELLGAS